jgi:hypothetical protein
VERGCQLDESIFASRRDGDVRPRGVEHPGETCTEA